MVGTVPKYYNALVLNGWYLPPFKSLCITNDYLLSVEAEEVYCPKYNEIRLRPHVQVLNKTELYIAIMKILKTKSLTLGIRSERKIPCVTWLTHVLSTI